MSNVNNNELGKFNEKAYREDRVNDLNKKYGINGYRDIEGLWNSTGNKFETVFGEYMTRKQVAEFFGNTETGVKWYSETRSGYSEELEGMDAHWYSNEEIKGIKADFVGGDTADEKYNNDITQTYRINSQGAVLYPLKAVVRLGMFMTGTPKAKLFRDAIQLCLQEGTISSKINKEVQVNLMDSVLESLLEENEIPGSKVMKSLFLLLEDGNNDLAKINENIEKLEELHSALDEFSKKEPDNAILAAKWTKEVFRISSKLNKLSKEYYEQFVEDMNSEESYTLMQLAEEFFPANFKKCGDDNEKIIDFVNKFTKKLIRMGVLKEETYTGSKNGKLRDDLTKIVSGNKYQFLNSRKYGNLVRPNSETLKFTQLGYYFIYYTLSLYTTDKTTFRRVMKSDESFLNFLYLELNNDENMEE